MTAIVPFNPEASAVEMGSLAEEGFTIDAPVVPFEAGQRFPSPYLLVGPGVPATMSGADDDFDPETGEVKERQIPTWIFEIRAGVRFSLLGASQLDRKLSQIHGQFGDSGALVMLQHTGEQKTRRGHRVNTYAVHHKAVK